MRAHVTGAAVFILALVALALAGDVLGEQRRRGSVSFGSPNKGRLINGAKLPSSGKGYYSNPARPNASAVYGTDELIATLVRAGSDVEARAPGASLFINDIGFAEGGQIPHHASHQAGRDADLLFYMYDRAGKVASPKCISFDRKGKALLDPNAPTNPDGDNLRFFDDQRNWLVVRSLVESSDANVQRIFVAETIRARILRYALEHDEPGWIIERAGEVMCEPGAPHDDHFHIRAYCTVEDYRQGCRDTWPLYPWRRTELAALGLTDPQLRRPLKRRARKRAKRAARKSPGRLWCP